MALDGEKEGVYIMVTLDGWDSNQDIKFFCSHLDCSGLGVKCRFGKSLVLTAAGNILSPVVSTLTECRHSKAPRATPIRQNEVLFGIR